MFRMGSDIDGATHADIRHPCLLILPNRFTQRQLQRTRKPSNCFYPVRCFRCCFLPRLDALPSKAFDLPRRHGAHAHAACEPLTQRCGACVVDCVCTSPAPSLSLSLSLSSTPLSLRSKSMTGTLQLLVLTSNGLLIF